MARLFFNLFIAGLFLIGRSSGTALKHAEKNEGTEVPPPHLQANSNSIYTYLSQLLLDIESTWCAYLKDNQKLFKDVLSIYFQHLNEFLCHNSSETSAFKNAFLTYSGLVKDPEGENGRLVWSTFERLRNMWCEFANNESLVSEQVTSKLNFTNLNWESIFKELPNDLLKLKNLLLGLEHNVTKRNSEVTSNNTTRDNKHSQNLKTVKRDTESIPNSAKVDFLKYFAVSMEQLGKQLQKYESEGKDSFDEDFTVFNVSVNKKLEPVLRSCSLSNTSASNTMKGCNDTVPMESAGTLLLSAAAHIGLEMEHSKFPTDYDKMSLEQQAKEKLRVLKAFYKAVSMMDKDKLFLCVYNFITVDVLSPGNTYRDLLEYLVECMKEKAMKPEFYKGERTFATTGHHHHHHRHESARLPRGLHQDFLFMNRLVKKVKRSANDRPMSKEEWKAKKEQFFRNQMFGQENIDPHNESLTDIEKNVKGILDGFAIESGSGDKPTTLKMSKKWKPVVQRIRRASGENLTDEVGSSEDEERLSLSQDEKIVLEEALDRIISAIINHRNELMSRTRKFISLVVHILAKSEKMEPEALSCIARAGVTFMSETRKHLNTVFKGFRSELETMKKTLWSEDSVDGSDKDETITKLISAELMRDVEDAIAASSRTYEVNKVRLFEKFMICKAKNSI